MSRHPLAGAAWLVLAGSVAVALLAAPAAAHEKNNLAAKTLVAQAIALLRTQPGQAEAIQDKLHDALEAKDHAGVDLALVRRADQAFDQGDRHRAWDLLEASIGAAPHRVVTQPNPKPRLPATTQPASSAMAMPTPTTATATAEAEAEAGAGAGAGAAHEVALGGGPQAPAGPGSVALLGLAGVLALAGAVVVRRVHR